MSKDFKFAALVPELYVSDYQTSLRFYRDLVGFDVEYTRENPSFALISLGYAQLMIQQIEPTDIHTGELTAPYGRGVNFEIAIDNADAVHALSNRLKGQGIELSKNAGKFLE